MIPKKIHQIWVGSPLPEKYKKFISNIKTLHENFEYKLWNDDDITKENFTNYDLICSTKCFAQKADIMRYEIVYKHGGIYLDIDFEIIKCLSDLLTADFVVCNEDSHTNQYMSNSFFASSVKNENLLRCIENIRSADFTLPVNVSTGPWFFRRFINFDENIKILPTITFYPKNWDEKHKEIKITDEIYGIHHWDKNWT